MCVGLWRSKEHQKLIFSENSIPVVFRNGEHGDECESVSDFFQGGHVTSPPLPGSKEHRKLFLFEKPFPVVFRHVEQDYECRSVSDHFRGKKKHRKLLFPEKSFLVVFRSVRPVYERELCAVPVKVVHVTQRSLSARHREPKRI